MAKASAPSKKKRLILLDTHAILHRAYHALPEFSSSKGEPTGALYGLVAMLVRIFTDLKPDYIAAAFDLAGATYRHEAFEGYKGKRPKTDDALVSQIERSRDVLTAFAIPIYEVPGFEADDVLGTIVALTKKEKNLEVIVASGDMDTMQLVDGKRVQVYTLKKGLNDTILYDEAAVIARFGFGPELIPDYKGFRGDPSDNIPGVRGIGEKTATSLITSLGSLEDIYKALKKDPEAAAKKAGLTPRLTQLLVDQEEEARFSKMLADIRRDAPVPFSMPTEDWKALIDTEHLMTLLSDLEFRTLAPRVRALLGAGAPAATPDEAPERAPETDPDLLARVQLALWVVDTNYTAAALEDALRFTKAKTAEEALRKLEEEIVKRKLTRIYQDIELPLMPLLRKMEKRGILVSKETLADLSKKYHKELDRLCARIYEAAGGEFNINSPKQLGEVLFVKLGLGGAKQKKTATGQLSTKESELEKLKDAHPVIGDILAQRELQKLLSNYIDSIPSQLDSEGRLHTNYVQAGTTTGRLSSRDPNLQNIPVKSELGRAIRSAFIAPLGWSLVSFDYSQIDLRVAAFLSGDEKLIDIFKRGKDVHAAVASQVFGVQEPDVTPEMRRRAKVINFGILYGMGVNALKENLGTDRKEAQAFYQNYFETFTTLAGYLEDTKAKAAKDGFVETFFGRRRYFDGIKSSIPYIRASAERMAINAPIQGTQADIMKLAMLKVEEAIASLGEADNAHLLLQVHDEIIYEMKDSVIAKLAPRIVEVMANILPLKETKGVPLASKAAAGPSWGALEPVDS